MISGRRQGASCNKKLEENLQAQLHVEGFTGPDARSAIKVADGVADDATCRTGRAYTGGEVHPIERVKQLDPELCLEPFGDRHVLENGEIQVRETGTVNLVAAKRAQESGAGRNKVRRIDPRHSRLVEGMGNTCKCWTQLIDALRVKCSANLVERLPAVEGHEAVHLPTVGQDLRTA